MDKKVALPGTNGSTPRTSIGLGPSAAPVPGRATDRKRIKMKILVAFSTFLLATACASRPGLDDRSYFAAADEKPAFSTAPSHQNSFRPIVGGTTEREGGGLTLGAQYEYHVTKDWGAGAFADITFGDSTAFVLGGAGYWHPVEELTLLAGPGVDFENDDVFARVGGSYEFKVKELMMGPAIYVDLGARKTPIFAGLLFSFDF